MICHRQRCDQAATHAPLICVPAFPGRRHGRAAARVIAALPLCASCVARLRPADLLDPADPAGAHLRAAISLQAQGRYLPDFDAVWIEPVSLTSPEWLQAQAARARSLS